MKKKVRRRKKKRGIFNDMVFTTTGFQRTKQDELRKLIEENGGRYKKSYSKSITHILSTEYVFYDKQTIKIKRGLKDEVYILKVAFLYDSIEKGIDLDEEDFEWPEDRVENYRKRKRIDETESEDEENDVKKPKRKERRIVKSAKGLPVPHKLSGRSQDGKIYVDDSGLYSCVLNLTSISQNSNKFYESQLIEWPAKKRWVFFNHFGRVGSKGSKQVLKFADLEVGKKRFKAKFLEKTGNHWDHRANFVAVPGKYTLIDVNYEIEEVVDLDETESEEDVSIPKKSILPEPVLEFIKRIADLKRLEKQLVKFNIDLQKMPVGNLSRDQLQLGYEILKDIEDYLQTQEDLDENDLEEDEELIEYCNEFYTKIPQNFGFDKPPILTSEEQIQEMREMLMDLEDIAIASKIIKESKRIGGSNPYLTTYKNLKCDLEPLKQSDSRYKLIKKYVTKTHAPTHDEYDLEIQSILKCNRHGEREKYLKKFGNLPNKQMLWHGSRITNFMGILSEGLRIAPPNVPVTGYMFGKGVYFADMVSKSANYCRATPEENVGCIILSEVALGNSLMKGEADATLSKAKVERAACDSVQGVGSWWVTNEREHVKENDVKWPIGSAVQPDIQQTQLRYNEFIVYDENQFNIQYLIIAKFIHKHIIID